MQRKKKFIKFFSSDVQIRIRIGNEIYCYVNGFLKWNIGKKTSYVIGNKKFFGGISKLLLPEIKTQVAYTGKKLSTYFDVKYQSKFEHQHDAVYYADYPNETCRENYIGESGRRDLKSHILRHSVDSGQANVNYEDFKIIVRISITILGNVKLLSHC